MKTRTMTVIKEWQTEEELEVPAHLEGKELEAWLSHHAEGVANDSVNAQWQGTYVTDENNDDVIDWT